jgi:phosphatidylglycerol:prolipoprotein diacylglycerol transferase
MHPILFQIGGFTAYSYGFCVAVAAALAFFVSVRRAPARGLSPGTAADLLFLVFIAGIIGARLFYVVQHFDDFRGNWLSVFSLTQGGLVWYGGFILASLAGILHARRRYLSVRTWADFFMPVLALAHGIGRVGCYLNGCCFGKDGHPAQLYEAAGLWALAAFLFWLAPRNRVRGRLVAWYLVLYGALRFGVEFLRGDQTPLNGLTLPQWISLVFFLTGLGMLKGLRASAHENED